MSDAILGSPEKYEPFRICRQRPGERRRTVPLYTHPEPPASGSAVRAAGFALIGECFGPFRRERQRVLQSAQDRPRPVDLVLGRALADANGDFLDLAPQQ